MDDTQKHITKILDLLYNECGRSGGDGDAAWYSRYHKLSDIIPVLEEYNSKLKFPHTIEHRDEKTLLWGDNQEWIIITNDVEVYNSLPEWEQMVIKC
jgi:hypothetical protein